MAAADKIVLEITRPISEMDVHGGAPLVLDLQNEVTPQVTPEIIAFLTSFIYFIEGSKHSR